MSAQTNRLSPNVTPLQPLIIWLPSQMDVSVKGAVTVNGTAQVNSVPSSRTSSRRYTPGLAMASGSEKDMDVSSRL